MIEQKKENDKKKRKDKIRIRREISISIATGGFALGTYASILIIMLFPERISMITIFGLGIIAIIICLKNLIKNIGVRNDE